MEFATATETTEDWTSYFSAEELAEMDAADTMREIEAGATLREGTWSELRREIMIRGGLAAGPYTRHYLPGQTYRVHGLPVDVMAADLADEGWGSWECAEDFLATLWKLWESEQAARAARVRRVATVETTTTETETSNDTTEAGLSVLRVEPGTAAVGAGRDDRSEDLPLRGTGLRPALGRGRRPGRATARRGRSGAAPARLTWTLRVSGSRAVPQFLQRGPDDRGRAELPPGRLRLPLERGQPLGVLGRDVDDQAGLWGRGFPGDGFEDGRHRGSPPGLTWWPRARRRRLRRRRRRQGRRLGRAGRRAP